MLNQVLVTQAQDLFNELLFGSGGWLGLIIVMSLSFLITYKIKYASIPFSIVSFFLGLLLWDNIATNNNLMWASIVYMFMPIFLLVIALKGE